ncbi:MAG: amidohydrolase [Thermomicrobiales bacterium]|nr:amidohydrolase [Thermomicrobiales bacterium]MCO5217805.1 amidohydrolase [Thermomicrobiales bacterium]MCO5223938.1 amidohydrolase [Thermomicrobiales bacterium]MCO5227501.1 amidohydrolase [Thermomicrobiales bacterium]
MSKTPVIDAHVHIFPPPMIENRERLQIEDSWFGETFGHPKAKMRTAEELIASMDKAGVDISIVVGWPWQSNEHCAIHNTCLADAASQWPDRIVWLGIVNPAAAGAIEEIDRCTALGAKGFGEVNADAQEFRWSEPEPWLEAVRRIESANLPLMIHTSEPVGHGYPGKGLATPAEVLAAIQTVPDLQWVLAHWGGGLPFYELMPEVRSACANVVYDSAATSYLYNQAVFRRVIDLVGVEKVLFGSDWPVLGQGKLLERVRTLPLTEREMAAVLGGNAARIYCIGTRMRADTLSFPRINPEATL